ncbi:MAG: hypothetical protein P8L39_14695, partial [Halioglobus sp.]|nr:hypothetical protein [Halioglobus sp.]
MARRAAILGRLHSPIRGSPVRKILIGGLLYFIVGYSDMTIGDQQENIFPGAPRSEDGRFTNLAGDIGHGSATVRLPF